MTSFRAERPRAGFRPLAGLCALLCVLAAPAAAQEALTPLELLPPASAVPEEGQTDSTAGEDVQIQNIEAAGPDGAGLLNAAEGGFDETLWRGSARPAAEALLERIGPPKGLAAARLTRRFLLSTAPPPPGAGKPGVFLERRVRALARAGRMDDVAALAGSIPDNFKTAPTRRAEAEALLLAGQDARACAAAVSESAVDPGAAHWALMLAYCQVLGGQESEAELIVSLLRETGDTAPGFEGLFSAMLARRPVTVTSLNGVGPLELAMMRTVSARLPEDTALPESPALYPALVRMESLPAGLRARALEASLALDLMTPEAARAAADSMPFDDAAVADALTFAKRDKGALGRVLLLRAVGAQKGVLKRAELITQAMRLAVRDNAVTAAARLFTPFIRELPDDDPGLVRFAEHGLRAGLAARDYSGVARWLGLMDAGGVFLPDVKTAHDRLLPYARVAGATGVRWGADSLEIWRQAAPADAPASGGADLAWFASVLSAFGEKVPPQVWAHALTQGADEGGAGLPGAAGGLLPAAAEAQRAGETIAAALIVLSETGGDLDAGAAFALVRALRQAGLEAEARALIMDVAAAKGF